MNLFRSVASRTSDRVLMEEARVRIDNKDFVGALNSLAKVKIDSNEKRLLQVSAELGNANFSLWQIILDLATGEKLKNSSKSGTDFIFDAFSDAVLGTESEQETKIAAIERSIELLQGSPQPDEDDVENLRCFLGGVLVFPSLEIANQTIDTAKSNLEQVVDEAQNGGSTADDCPNVSLVNDAMEDVSEVRQSMSLILGAVQGCAFFDVSEAADKLNQVEKFVNNLGDQADKGCTSTPDCGDSKACDALQLGCVAEVVQDEAAQAGDGEIATCELMQNCIGSSCFETE
jgi:hypothetical protein